MKGKVEVGAEILLRIAREFGRTMEWLLQKLVTAGCGGPRAHAGSGKLGSASHLV